MRVLWHHTRTSILVWWHCLQRMLYNLTNRGSNWNRLHYVWLIRSTQFLGVYEKKYFKKAEDCLFLDNFSYNSAFSRFMSNKSCCSPIHVIGVSNRNRRFPASFAILISLSAVHTSLWRLVCSANSSSAYNIAKKKFNRVGIEAIRNPDFNSW